MSVNTKHIATFLLGVAAGIAVYKYSTMTPQEKEKLAKDVKDKANKFKTEAAGMMDKAKDYFEELRTKGGEALKDHVADAEKTMQDLFGSKGKTTV